MNRIRKAAAIVALGATGTAAVYVGNGLVQDVKFAHAEEQVHASRQELQKAEDLASVYKAVGKAVDPSVVKIVVSKTVRGVAARRPDEDFFKHFFQNQEPDQQQDSPDNASPNQSPEMPQMPESPVEEGEGSGVVMDVANGYGYILTNNHVAGGASKLTVTLSDGTIVDSADCKLLGADPKTDLAVVQIKAEHLIPAKWGDSDQLEKGDLILAFGAPFDYVGSMTHGIVSALHRTDVGILERNNAFSYENFIQVDAAINPGNSGGPLVNLQGEVVGINTAIATRSGSFSGIGFAIPSDEAHPIYNALKEKGHVTRGWLGVVIGDVSDPKFKEQAKMIGFTGDTGVFVREVFNNTPASGKLQPRDIVTGLNGKSVMNSQELRNIIANQTPNSTVKMQLFRDKQNIDVDVKLGEQPDDMTASGAMNGRHGMRDDSTISPEGLGMQLTNLTEDAAGRFGLGDTKSGALVMRVDPNSPAGQAGLEAGDVITRVGDKDVTDVDSAAQALSKMDPKKGFPLNITNREGSRYAFIKTGK